ncbi:MAG: PQQ-dependent sugar dehydrogenase [Kofleriaceae bacterium]
MRAIVGAFLGASVLVASPAEADVSEPAFRQTDVTRIENNPQVTSMAWAPDGSGRLFVTGKEGHIWIVKGSVVQPNPAFRFMPRNQGGELVTSSECGLLGIAFDPAFADNGYIYVFVTLHVPAASNQIEQQIIRFTMQGDTATERTTLIDGLPSTGANHDGGGLDFGPDGLIYWAVGDNGSGVGHGEDLESAGSKVGRATTVVGAPPPPGMFNDGDGPNYDHIHTRGTRNPYSMLFHPVTGELWISIVGDGWEQIFAVGENAHVGYPMENVEPGVGGATTSPIVAYRTGGTNGLNLGAASAVRANNVVTITTSGAHRLRKGATVTIAGIDDASFDGTFAIASVPSLTSFTYAQTAGDATSGNGTAQPDDYGNVILGGAFYDATLFPQQYRQNYFFGDFGTGQFVRVETASDNSVSRVSRFGTNLGNHIDASTGPDGALYVVDHGGNIRRISYDTTAQGIVVSPQNLRLSETSRGFVGVRLAIAPASDVTVTLARASGSTFVRVPQGTLTFTPANWDQPQYVEVTSAIDGDTVEDIAMLEASSTGIGTETVTVRVTDTQEADPSVIDSANPAVDGGGGTDASGCCGVGDSRGSFVLAMLVGGLVLRRRRARA